MDIKVSIIDAGIKCVSAACISKTEYVCYDTTPDKADTVLKSIGVYPEYRSFWSEDSEYLSHGTVYINKMYNNSKSWD